MSFVAVGIGAVLGAWLRWGLSVLMNPIHSHLPLGTMVANLGGGLVIGAALAFFNAHPALAPEWRQTDGLPNGRSPRGTRRAAAAAWLRQRR